MGLGIIVSFAPWIIFWILAGETFFVATLGAFVVSIVMLVPELLRHKPKILDVGTLVFFAVMTVAALTVDRGWFERYANPLSDGALALITLVSILVRMPFTMQYARDSVPQQYWTSPGFIRAGYLISSVWCASFIFQTVSTLLAALVPSLNKLVFLYVLPNAALVVALAYTRWYIHHAEARRPAEETGPSPAPAH
jgi:hypothetical protein